MESIPKPAAPSINKISAVNLSNNSGVPSQTHLGNQMISRKKPPVVRNGTYNFKLWQRKDDMTFLGVEHIGKILLKAIE